MIIFRFIILQLLYILDRFIDRISSVNFMDDLSTAKQKYLEAISTCVNYYVLLENT